MELTRIRTLMEALIAGMLPEYEIPKMHSGGYISREGPYYLHAGETVVPAGGGNVNISMTVNVPAYARPEEVTREIEDALLHSLRYGRGRRAVREVVGV